MNALQQALLRGPAVQFAGESEEPVAGSGDLAWSLDELDRWSDLESVRTAWTRTDDPHG